MRLDAFSKPGGDLLQIQKYIDAAEARGRAGWDSFTGEIIVDLNVELSRFDIVHLTNLDRPAELSWYFMKARAADRPMVLSPIHHSYSEIERFERTGRHGILGLLSRTLRFDQLESLRSVVRSARYPQLFRALLKTMPGGIHDAQLRVLDGVDRILLLTQKEGDDIIKDFGPIRPKKPVYLRNGSDAMPRSPADPSTRDLDICVVGRIEARKNQIAILEAVNQLGLSAVFVGRENPYHKAYCNEFKRRIANSCSAYISGLPHEEILHLMERAKVHVSASWFEVASLVDIEAYLAGCRIVASECGGTRELCGIDAHYVDPSSARSIEMAIRAAYEAATDGLLREGRRQSRAVESWQEVAASLSEIYQAVLSEHDVQTADSRIEAEPVARA